MKTKNLYLTLICACAKLCAQTPGPVVQWNRDLVSLLRTPGAQPATVHPTRTMAILHAAIYDAVNSIDKSHAPYKVLLAGAPADASLDAAAAAAGHEVLLTLFPGFQAFVDSEYQQLLSQIPDGAPKSEGVQVGTAVAGQIIQIRANDGSGVVPPVYTPTNAPGIYQLTPPNFAAAVFTHWPNVTPFALSSSNQFRPGPPPELTSQTYTNDFNEVKSLGGPHSPAATSDQQLIGVFWNGAIQNYWNEITQMATLSNKLTTAQAARLFALVNLSLADTVIAFYDTKYTYTFWRPVTAIRAADTDGNPNTQPDPNFLPETRTTAADPSYPGAHGAISAAAAAVLASFFGTDQFSFNLTSEVFAGVQRSFTSFSGASQEAFLSRIYAGQHFRFDQAAGAQLGNNVAGFVVTSLLH
jgi:membrane-associated phospholipid phosphatase